MSTITVGEAIARTLEAYAVSAVYGVISIHNLPIADAVGRRDKIRFVPARGEAGSVTMADAHTRVGSLGVALTSTGAGAGNAIGGLLEALNAGTPLLHITGQVEKAYLDRDAGFIHETKDQLTFLRASSKAAYRVCTPEQAVPLLHRAIREAMTLPRGPVSLEIPIDIQASPVEWVETSPVAPATPAPVADAEIDALAERLATARRPLLWIGGGTLEASEAVRRLADAGIPVVSSTHARGVLPDGHPRSLRAFHNAASVEALFAESDLMVVAGSRLRSNETKTYSVELPRPLVQIDVDPAAAHRNYRADAFLCGDCADVLGRLADRLAGRKPDAAYDAAVAEAVSQAEQALRTQVGEYAKLSDAVRAALPEDGIFVRDITVSGSTWGSRLLPIERPLTNIHSLAGAIGLGLAHGIGCAVARPDRKVVTLVGDGGLALGLGELATMAQEKLDMTLIVMNDGGYGVMRGIQEKYFEGRQYYNELHTPNFQQLADAMGIQRWKVSHGDDFAAVLAEAVGQPGPALVEVDMPSVGELKFSGPPQKTLY
ncbi:thiamine pyrophosphate-binding protein [Halomonas campisalis]|uniref:Thiamine pyrophosphate-binding protein n=1 Tax=Billgrantia campisalis TaxID=74661 RepID=A0ABS9P4S9_9GAMM|nr:thiamine pyrophosphate-binding protein [Halomonas campisalis]MCG6656779.1 thiamine pyrophosphate-binding protein [Halomonas campisalis]MDR5861968.1 thiamine pyrophosphate-binding protein [Halomonas campisalis]